MLVWLERAWREPQGSQVSLGPSWLGIIVRVKGPGSVLLTPDWEGGDTLAFDPWPFCLPLWGGGEVSRTLVLSSSRASKPDLLDP